MNTTLSLSDAIDQLLAEDKIASLPAWEGAPLGFTSRYYSAADLDAAAERRALVDATKPWHDRTPARMKSRLLRRVRASVQTSAAVVAAPSARRRTGEGMSVLRSGGRGCSLTIGAGWRARDVRVNGRHPPGPHRGIARL